MDIPSTGCHAARAFRLMRTDPDSSSGESEPIVSEPIVSEYQCEYCDDPATVDDRVCDDCDDAESTCDQCGNPGLTYSRASLLRLGHWIENDRCPRHRHMCPECGASLRYPEDARSCCAPSSDSYGIYSYSHRPDTVFHVSGGRVATHAATVGRAFFGVELEVYGDWNELELPLLRESDPGEDRYYFKEDSSVSMEIVTHPGTLAAWRDGSVIHWGAWAEWKEESRARVGDGAGMHIHMNRNAFGPPCQMYLNAKDQDKGAIAALYRYAQLFYANPGPWQSIGRRENCHWAKFAPENGIPVELLANAKGKYSQPAGRYSALNFENTATIEHRFPAATLARSTIVATLELLDAAHRHAMSKGHTGPHYQWATFLRDSVLSVGSDGKQRYPEAVKYLRRRNLANPATAPAPIPTQTQTRYPY